MKNQRINPWLSMLLVMFFLAACSGGSGTDSIEANSNTGTGTVASTNTGTLSLGLIDKSTDEYQAVYVTIDEVQVHRCEAEGEGECEGTWIKVANPEKTFNLLELVNGVIAPLGDFELESGFYTQMRLYLGDEPDAEDNILDEPHPEYPHYVILDNPDNDYQELKVPSGYKSGIKLVRGFEIKAGATVDLLLDFDAKESVVKAGKSGKYLLKPTIKVIDTIENATVSGMVTDDLSIGLGGVPVSAQIYQEGTGEEPGDISTYTTTFTAEGDEDLGQYMMFLPPGNYNIVAYKSGFDPLCRSVAVEYGDVLGEDFQLMPAEQGTISGVVDIEDNPNGQTAILSFRQACGEIQTFEVESLTDVYGEYSIDLPEGIYEVVCSSAGRETQVFKDIPVVEGSPVQLNFNLQMPN